MFGIADPSHFLRGEYFKKYIDSLKPQSILDAGCGGGDYSFYMAERWPKALIHAGDLVEETVKKDKSIQLKMEIKNISFHTMDIMNLQYNNTFDLIICIDVIEHILDQKTVLSNFYRALKSGGYLYIHIPLVRPRPEPCKKYLKAFHEWTEKEHIGEEKTRAEILEMLGDCNFTILKNRYTFHYYFGEMACSLFSIFFRYTPLNRFIQGLLSPITRLLCYGDLLKERNEGFALAVLAQKK